MRNLRFFGISSGPDNRILALVLGCVGCFFSTLVWGDVTAEVSQVGESLHLELKGQDQWDYNLNHKPSKAGTDFEIEVPRLKESSVQQIQRLKNSLLESATVRRDGSDGKDVIVLRLKGKDFESFDYLTDQPSRLIVDFFKDQKKQATAEAAAVPAKKFIPKKKNTSSIKVLPVDRKPSSTDVLTIANQGPLMATPEVENTSGIFDGGDPNFERFKIKDYEIKEDSAIAAGENYYIKFPMLQIPDQHLSALIADKPEYKIKPADNEENKQARLLLTLFENQRYNVFLKAVSWFNEKFPDSKYDEIIRFMWADTHFALWMKDHDLHDFDLAMLRYRQALEKYPKSALVERTMMLMGFASQDRGDFLGSLRLFNQHMKDRPQSPNHDIARLAIARSYANLSKFDEAAKAYDDIERQASAKSYQMTAGFSRADVEFQRKNYPEAVELYQKFLKKYPEGASQFPSAYYNQAAAYFEMKKPRESLNTYLEFLKKFPSHPYAGYAMTRVGEILDMLGADKSRVIGAYLETYFRYGDSPSSVVARLRLLSIRMSAMKEKEIDKAVADILELTKKSSLDKIDQFATVLLAEGYASRHDFDKSVEILSQYYKQNPTTADTDLVKNRIVRDINAKIRMLVDKGDFIAALKTHSRYSDTWLKNSDRIDTKYQIARAFEQAGAPAEAEKLYRTTLNQMLALKGMPAEKQRNIYEKLPTTDQVELRLAQVEEQLGRDVQAYEQMKNIRAPEALSDLEQIERVQLASQLLEKKGDLTSATRYLMELVRTWKGNPELVAQPYLQLAELEIKDGRTQDAIKSYEKIDQLNEDSAGLVPVSIHEKALEKLADLQLETGAEDQAIKTYQNLLEKYGSKIPIASYRYKLGKIFFKRGDLAKANEAWGPLKSEKSSVWYDLAQEQLKNSEWNQDYKKYIKRIPAMSKEE